MDRVLEICSSVCDGTISLVLLMNSFLQRFRVCLSRALGLPVKLLQYTQLSVPFEFLFLMLNFAYNEVAVQKLQRDKFLKLNAIKHLLFLYNFGRMLVQNFSAFVSS